jgi:hypothetical protein
MGAPHQLLRVRSAVQKSEIGNAMQLGITGAAWGIVHVIAIYCTLIQYMAKSNDGH